MDSMLHKPKWLSILTLAIYLFLYLPIFILIAYSFDESRLAVQWTGFTLKWYKLLLIDEPLIAALGNSLIVACVSVSVSAVMGTMAAVGLSRYHFWGKKAYKGLLFIPIIVPEVALAVSALTLFVAMGITLSLATIIIAHVVFCVAYVTLVVMGRLEGLDPHLEEAAQDLGAPPAMAFFKVTLPLIMPGIIAGCLLAFVLSLDDFVITQFTAGVGNTTLPLRIYSLVKFGISPEINALSTLMIVCTVGLALLAQLIKQHSEFQR
ncbi:MAG: ABC transporter permease [Candidatus Melainabacteria bacterium]|nr:ABC transporter permease [Candidatus Melainabacteria bacterium]